MTGRRAANLGHAVASLLFLLFLASALAVASWIFLSVRLGSPEAHAGDAVVREIVHANPAPFTLRPGVPWRSGEITLAARAASLQVEMWPRARLADESAPESGPASRVRSGPSMIEVSWRAVGGSEHTRRLALGARRPLVVELEEADAGAASVSFGLRLVGRSIEAAFEPGGFLVVGTRAPLFPALARSLLVVACAAFVLAAVTQWFSAFVGPVIAVSAALTVAIVVVFLRSGGAGEASWAAVPMLAGFLPRDPVAGLRLGHATAWPDVLRGLGAAAAATIAACAAAVPSQQRDAA